MNSFAKEQITMETKEKCRLCGVLLDPEEDDDLTHEVCDSCKSRPEARHLGIPITLSPLRVVGKASPSKSAREFTAAEKGLIRKVHGYMPAQQLLSILNERLVCDLGPDAMPYTMEQLYAEIGDVAGAVAPAGGHDWASLRDGRNPRTGETIKIAASKVMQFKTSPALNKTL